MNGKSRRLIALALTALLSAGVISASFADAKVNRYPVQAVTIKVDRSAHRLSGKVIADSTVQHFCTTGDWPLNVFRVRAGKDKKVAHRRTNFSSEWTFDVPKALRGARLYAQVPSYPVHEHGYCVGTSSRAVRAG